MRTKQSYKSKSNPNPRLLSEIEYRGDVNIPTSVELIQYNEKEYAHKTLTDRDDLKKHIKEGMVNWFNITGISNVNSIRKICESFGLHHFDIRELLTDTNMVKFVLYENITFALIAGYSLNEKSEISDTKIAFILGDNFVVSFKESATPVFNEVEKAISENNVIVRQKSADFLLYMLLYTVNSINNHSISQSENSLWEIEDQLILHRESRDILHTLRNHKKNYMTLRRFMLSLEEEYDNLLDNSNQKIRAENMVYFENLDDKYRATSGNILFMEESIKSLLELFNSNNAMRMNEIMKRLTLVATIFIPLTFLVGVWGMNFDNMPELNWKYGYMIAWIIFISIAVAGIYLMKKKKWI